MERFESCTQTNRAKQLREVFGSKILRLLTISVMLFSGCKDKKITDVQENLRRLTELCVNERSPGYCNDSKPKSVIKFAIEDGKIVFDPGKNNFVYSENGQVVADIMSEEEARNAAKQKLADERNDKEADEIERNIIDNHTPDKKRIQEGAEKWKLQKEKERQIQQNVPNTQSIPNGVPPSPQLMPRAKTLQEIQKEIDAAKRKKADEQRIKDGGVL